MPGARRAAKESACWKPRSSVVFIPRAYLVKTNRPIYEGPQVLETADRGPRANGFNLGPEESERARF